MINVELLEKILFHIEESSPEQFDMSNFAWTIPNTHPCQSTACIAGWAIHLGSKRLSFQDIERLVLANNPQFVLELAAQELNVDREDLRDLVFLSITLISRNVDGDLADISVDEMAIEIVKRVLRNPSRSIKFLTHQYIDELIRKSPKIVTTNLKF